MSQYVDFNTAKGMIIKMEELMPEVFPQWEKLSIDAKQYVMLRYAHMTFAFLAKECHVVELSFVAIPENGILQVTANSGKYALTEMDRSIIDNSQLIWAAMPVVPDGSMSLSLDGSSEVIRFECDYVWDTLKDVYSEVLYQQEVGNAQVQCIYRIIPMDAEGNDCTEE